MEYIMSDRNMNHSLVSKLILLYVCCQFIECREYTDGPSFLNHSAKSDVYNCSLKPAFEETVAELGQVINKNNRLIKLEITIESNSSAANRSYPSSMQWLLPITDSGKRLLILPENYTILSLGTLSFGTAQIHLHIHQEPDECLGNATSADVEKLLQHMVLSLANTVDSRNKDRKDTIYICNSTVHSDGYCCKISADMINVNCEALETDSMYNIISWILAIVSLAFTFQILYLIPEEFYKECEKHTFDLNDASFYVRVAISKDRDTLKDRKKFVKYRNKFEKVSVTPDCLHNFREKLMKCISDVPMDISKSQTFIFRLKAEILSCLVDNEHLQQETFPVPSALPFLYSAVKKIPVVRSYKTTSFSSTSSDRHVAVFIFFVILVSCMPRLVLAFPATDQLIFYIILDLILLICIPLSLLFFSQSIKENLRKTFHTDFFRRSRFYYYYYLCIKVVTYFSVIRILFIIISKTDRPKKVIHRYTLASCLSNFVIPSISVIVWCASTIVLFYIKCLILTMLGIILNYEKCFPYVILILMFFKFSYNSVNDARQDIHKLIIRVFKTIRELSVDSQCDVTNQVYILQENAGRDCFSRFAICENGTVSFLASGLMVFNKLIQPENIYVKHIHKTFLNDVASLPGQLTPGSMKSIVCNCIKEIMSIMFFLGVIGIFVSTFTNEDDISDLVLTFVTFVTGDASSKLITFWYRGKSLSSDEDDIYFKELVRNYLTKHEEQLPIEEFDYDLTCIGEQDETDPDKTSMLIENLDTEDEAWYVVPIKMSEEENLTGSQVETV